MNEDFKYVSKFSKSLILPHELAKCLTKKFEENNIKILKGAFTEEAIKFKVRFEQQKKLLVNEQKEYRTKRTGTQRFEEEHVLFEDMVKAVKAEIVAISRNFYLSIKKDKMIIQVNDSEELSEMAEFYLRNYFSKIISLVINAFEEVGIRITS